MKIAHVIALSAALAMSLSACGSQPESGSSSQPAQSAQSSTPQVPAPADPVKDYMSANFSGEYDVISTSTRSEVRVYGLSREDVEALVESLDGITENISVSDYSVEGSSILYTYQNGKLTYDADNTEDFSIQGNGAVTMEIYQKIKNGMTYNEVVNLIGADGTPVVSVGDGEFQTESYSWPGENSEYSSASVTFQGGVVAGKLQIGLDQDWG